MSHFKQLCRGCGSIMAQCRCPSPNKEIRWGTCSECAALGLPFQVPPTGPANGGELQLTGTGPANGGDVIIRAGRAGEGDPLRDIPPGHPGNVRFQTPDGDDMLVIRADGSAFVRGTEIPDTDEGNRQLFHAFLQWLRHANLLTTPEP